MAKNTQTKVKKKKVKASDMLFLAVLVFLSQYIELLFREIIMWTPLIDVLPLGNDWWTLIHRALCVMSWAGIMYLIVKSSRKCGYDPVVKAKDVKHVEWIIPTIITALFVGYFIISDGGINTFFEMLGNMGGFLGTISYPIFLAAHVALMTLVIALSHKALEIAFPNAWKYLPLGGIFLGLAMVIVNLISGIYLESVELLALPFIFAINVLYGIVYVLTGKRALLAYPFIYLMFFIL